MEVLPALPQELVLDRLTPQQIVLLCRISSIYQRLCATYWPARVARRLRATPEQWGSPANPVQHYLNLFNQCLPGSLDKPLTRDCARAVGSRAQSAEVNRYLDQGGNPEDIAYGAASALVPGVVMDLIQRYPAFANYIVTQALRGAGSVGNAGLPYHPYVVDPTNATTRYNIIVGAAETGLMERVQAAAAQLGLMPQQAGEILADQGYIGLAQQLGQEVLPYLVAYKIGDRDFIRNQYQNLEGALSFDVMLAILAHLSSLETIKWFMQMVHANPPPSELALPNIIPLSILYNLAIVNRDDDFLELVRWLQQTPPPISPVPNLDILKRELAKGSNFRLMQWATSS